ncbi:hypothetical protein [Brumimicrobium mesophilum]|uniref:hypothetical protein n=1 Tax=Brumimicrobium mesophilum TaxID=392717 RepID=UPI000D13FECF|nr:hypothetical protein [Brumimicrobium mesophilum]
MKFIKFLLFSLIVFAFSACLIPYLVSKKDPKIEDSNEYNSYLSKMGGDTTYSYQLPQIYKDSINVSPYAFYNYKIEKAYPQSTTQIIVFDSSGKLYYGYDACFGLYELGEIFDSIPFNKNIAHFEYNMNKEMSLDKHLDLLELTSGERELITKEIKLHEFTVFVHYVKYNGLLVKKIIKKYNRHISKNDVDAFTIYVNRAIKE